MITYTYRRGGIAGENIGMDIHSDGLVLLKEKGKTVREVNLDNVSTLKRLIKDIPFYRGEASSEGRDLQYSSGIRTDEGFTDWDIRHGPPDELRDVVKFLDDVYDGMQYIVRYEGTDMTSDYFTFRLDKDGDIAMSYGGRDYEWYYPDVRRIDFIASTALKSEDGMIWTSYGCTDEPNLSDFILDQIELITAYDLYYTDNDSEVWLNSNTGDVLIDGCGREKTSVLLPPPLRRRIRSIISSINPSDLSEYLFNGIVKNRYMKCVRPPYLSRKEPNDTMLMYIGGDEGNLYKYYWVSPIGEDNMLGELQRIIIESLPSKRRSVPSVH